jgi:hypothetical protein
MVHLLVFVAVVDSDDLFLITTFIVFALEGKEDVCMEREFLHLHIQHASHFQGGVYRKKKGVYGKQRKGAWVSILLYRSFFGVWWIFYWSEAIKHEIPL